MVKYGKRSKAAGKFRRPFKRRSFAVGPTTAQVTLRSETKCMDIPLTGVVLSSTSGSQPLNSLAAGTDLYQRIGRQIQMMSVHIKGQIFWNGQTCTTDTLRIAVVYDRQPDGVTAGFNDVFTSIDNAGGVTVDSSAFRNMGNIDRFKVLADFYLAVTPNGAAAALGNAPGSVQSQMEEFHLDRYIPLKGLVARWAAGAGVQIPQSGQLLLVYKGTVAAASAPYSLEFTTRVCYKDN